MFSVWKSSRRKLTMEQKRIESERCSAERFRPDMRRLRARMVYRFGKFADETTIHGFREMIHSQSCTEKIFWLCVIFFCVAFFVVHTVHQLRQYVEGKNSLVITTISDIDYVRPIVYIRLFNWSYVDTRKLRYYNISYEELQIAKSYMEPVEFASSVDIKEAKRSLNEKFKLMNVSNIQKFFWMISFEADSLGFGLEKPLAISEQNGTIEHFLRVYYKEDVAYYVVNLENAKKKTIQMAMAAMYKWNFTTYWDNLRRYGLPDVDEHLLKFRPLLSCQMFEEIFIDPSNRYSITYDVRIYKPLQPCKQLAKHLLFHYSTEHCRSSCEVTVNRSLGINTCFLYDLSISRLVAQWPLCSTGLQTYNNNNNNTGTVVGRETPRYRRLTVEQETQRRQKLHECQSQCLRLCSQYTVSASLSTTMLGWDETEPNITSIRVYYPNSDMVTVLQEKDIYSLLDFVSDLGGVLGLWLGASVISVFQLSHFCLWQNKQQELENEQSSADTITKSSFMRNRIDKSTQSIMRFDSTVLGVRHREIVRRNSNVL